jgi:hypothetical protein
MGLVIAKNLRFKLIKDAALRNVAKSATNVYPLAEAAELDDGVWTLCRLVEDHIPPGE